LTGVASLCLGDLMVRMRLKSDLPSKLCVVGRRLFVWRKKWARDWDNVKFCSGRCRMTARRTAGAAPDAPA